MTNLAIQNLIQAQQYAMSIRPKVGGFPYLAEVLKQAGVTRNVWQLPACQSIYYTEKGIVINQGESLVSGMVDVPLFDRDALIRALRRDQAGEGSFPEFLKAAWAAGVIRYEVDFIARTVTYYGAAEEAYVEDYPAVQVTR